MNRNFPALLAIAMLCAASVSQATVIINGGTQGLYNNSIGDMAVTDGAGGFFLAANSSEGDPNNPPLIPEPSFTTPAAFGADWLNGDYSGGTWSAGPAAIPSNWAVNTETAIVYDFSLTSLSNLHFDLGVDNGILVWLDGSYIFGAQQPGGASLNEYDLDLSSISAGAHSLQIIREDHGGGTGFAISVDATAVSEPGMLALLGLGLVGIGFSTRNRLS